MAFADKLLNRFAKGELDRVLFRKLNHPCNSIAIGAAFVRKPGQGYRENFLNRFELASGKLFADQIFLLGFEFNRHLFSLPEGDAACNYRECK